jgi:hypothetical protein
MPAPKGPLWKYFLIGSKQNKTHYRAHCIGCIQNECPTGVAIELDDNRDPKVPVVLDSFVYGI